MKWDSPAGSFVVSWPRSACSHGAVQHSTGPKPKPYVQHSAAWHRPGLPQVTRGAEPPELLVHIRQNKQRCRKLLCMTLPQDWVNPAAVTAYSQPAASPIWREQPRGMHRPFVLFKGVKSTHTQEFKGFIFSLGQAGDFSLCFRHSS